LWPVHAWLFGCRRLHAANKSMLAVQTTDFLPERSGIAAFGKGRAFRRHIRRKAAPNPESIALAATLDFF
jgi:hypothetical protein